MSASEGVPILACGVICLTALFGCDRAGREDAAPAEAEAEAEAEAAEIVAEDTGARKGPAPDAEGIAEPLDVGPISYFQRRCARCHGDYGSLYPRPFHTPASELPGIVEEMVFGPAMAPLEERPLRALVAYHVTMRSGEPFLAWVGRDGDTLAFELSPGAELGVAGGEATKAGEHTWSVAGDPASISVEVRAGGERVEVGRLTEAWHPRRGD